MKSSFIESLSFVASYLFKSAPNLPGVEAAIYATVAGSNTVCVGI